MRLRWTTSFLIAALVIGMAVFALSGCSGEQGERDGLHAQVPDVTGQRLNVAVDRLEEAGYGLGQVTWTDVADRPQGVVMSQNPIGGTSVARGESIDLVVAGTPETVP